MFDVFAKEGKPVYKNKDTCPRELKPEKKLATSTDFQPLEEICFLEHSGAQGSDQRLFGAVVHCLLGFLWWLHCFVLFWGFLVKDRFFKAV